MYWYAAGLLADPTPNFYHAGGPAPGNLNVPIGVENNQKAVFPFAGQIKNLSVNTHNPIMTGGQTFTVRQNGGDTALTCTVCASPPGCCAAGTTCSSTTSRYDPYRRLERARHHQLEGAINRFQLDGASLPCGRRGRRRQ
jgi:hypothetical protein